MVSSSNDNSSINFGERRATSAMVSDAGVANKGNNEGKKDDVFMGSLNVLHSDSSKDLEGESTLYTEVAEVVKKKLEEAEKGAWHVIVGKDFGSFVSHETKHLLYFAIGQVEFLVFRHG